MAAVPVTIVASLGASARFTASVLASQICGSLRPRNASDGVSYAPMPNNIAARFSRSGPSFTPICAKYWLHETSYA